MKLLVVLSILSIGFISCAEQVSYFKPVGIIDKTQAYVNLNKSWILLEDYTSIDGYTRIGDSIFGGEIACNIGPLKNVDASTFEVFPGSKYARDKAHVYYPLATACVDYSDCGVCYYQEIIIKNANPNSFQYLGNDYAVDDKSAYFRGKKIAKADGETFQIISGPEFFYFAIDSAHVYRHNDIFKEADPATFYCDAEDKRDGIIIGDKKHEWKYSPPASILEIEKR